MTVDENVIQEICDAHRAGIHAAQKDRSGFGETQNPFTFDSSPLHIAWNYGYQTVSNP